MTTPAPAVSLRPFERRHLTRTLEWTNDPEFAKLMDRPRSIEPDEHERWFAALAGRDDTTFFAIELEPGQQHVGNVWLAEIDRRHGKAELRVIIGERHRLGHGVGSQALDLAARHAFDALHLHRVYAYVLAINPRARRAFEKAGFVVEGVLRDDRRAGDEYTDVFVLGRIAS
jgi:RimJ/RimL family protein N-acetyltransferase